MTEYWGDTPIHPIINRPHEFDITRFDYQIDPRDFRNSFIDLTLQRGDEVRRLRFLRPRTLQIEDGFPMRTGGVIILDISDRQWEDLKVEVADFEASYGSVTFYAADVVDLDSQCKDVDQ